MFKREQVFASTLEYFQGDALAADVFVNKYCLQDDHGFYETTPQKMHWRLAQEFARPDLKYEFKLDDLPSVKEGWTKSEYYEFYAERVSMYFHLIDRFKFVIPQGSPMSALGNPYQIQSASNCFIPGTEVHTKNGSKPIESIEIGDEVVTHKGRYRKVVQIHKNKLDKRRLYKFKAYRTPPICVTENHEFLSISKEQLGWGMSPQWNSIGYLRVGDYIQIPSNIESAEENQYLDLFSVFKNSFRYGDYFYDTVEHEEGKFSLITKYTVGDKSCKKIHKNLTPKKILIDEDFAYFLGLWYGDGCIFGENTKLDKDNSRDRKSKRCTKIRGLTFTLGSHESKIIYFVCSYLEKQGIVFDLNSDLKDGTTQIVIHNGALGYAFEHYFGRRFDGKRLNSFIHSWNKNLVFALLRGLIDSDGTITSAGDIRVVMSNYALLKDIYHLARSYGFLVGFSPTEKSCRLDFGRNSKIRTKSNKEYADTRVSETLSDFTQHTIEIDGKTFVQITSKDLCEEEFEFVYTLGIEEDHSYSVEGLICKNCFVLPSVGDSYSQIMKTDQELAQLSKRRGGVGFDISKLRPEGAPVSNAAKTSSGIISFMERFSNTTREVGQCIAKGERVLTKRGLVAIEEVRPRVDEVWTKVGWVSVSDVKQNGLKEIVKTTTSRGYSIKTSEDHVFLNAKLEEIAIKNFELGDELCLLVGTEQEDRDRMLLETVSVANVNGQLNDSITQPTILSENLAYLIGYSYGDGCVRRNKYNEPTVLELACSNSYPEIKEKLIGILRDEFGYIANLVPGDGDLERIRISSKIICTFLERNNLLKQKSDAIEMPSRVINASQEIQAAFLSGYFDADGYASGKKNGYVFSSVQVNFLKDVQIILLALGCVSRLRKEDRSHLGWQDLWSLNVTGTFSQERFVNIMQDSVKVKNLNFIAKRDNVLTPWQAKELGIKSNNYSYINGNQNLSLGAYARVLKETGAEAMPNPMFCDEIVSFETVDFEETYDLVLEKEHLFWCEGFYVHNSGRRAALLMSCSVHHPDIEKFITIKSDRTKVTGANISVAITDEFMKAVIEDADYEQRWPCEGVEPKIRRVKRARDIWDLIIKNAWENAEPGVIFIDKMRNYPGQHYDGYEVVSTNPLMIAA